MHVIVAQRPGADPLILNNGEADEATLRTLCAAMAENGMSKVVLHALNDASVLVPLQVWRKTSTGRVRKTKPDTRESTHTSADVRADDRHEDETAEVETETTTPGVDAQIKAAADADNAERDERMINGYCLPERIHVDFHPTEIVTQANGTKRAVGICPSCGRGINKIMSRVQADEWGEDAEPDDVAVSLEEQTDDGPDADLTEMVEDAVAQVAQGENVAEVAAATAQVAIQFSEAQTEAEKPAPKPRASRAKNKDKDNTETAKDTADKVKTGTCPQCQQRVPIIEKRGIDVYSKHFQPNSTEIQCAGSFTVL